MQVQLQLPKMLFAEAPQDFQHHQRPLSEAICTTFNLNTGLRTERFAKWQTCRQLPC